MIFGLDMYRFKLKISNMQLSFRVGLRNQVINLGGKTNTLCGSGYANYRGF